MAAVRAGRRRRHHQMFLVWLLLLLFLMMMVMKVMLLVEVGLLSEAGEIHGVQTLRKMAGSVEFWQPSVGV